MSAKGGSERMSETKQTLKQERIKLFRDATANRKTYRIPHRSYFTTWMFFDAGYRLIEASEDYEKQEASVRHHYEAYHWDGMSCATQCNYGISRTLGTNWYNYDAEADAISCVDQPVIQSPEEIREYIDNPKKFIYEKWMTRKYKVFNNDMPAERMQAVFKARDDYFAANAKIGKLAEEFQLPPMASAMAPITPLEHMIDYYLGIKETSILMRRDPGLFQAFADAIYDYACKPAYNYINSLPDGPNLDYAFDGHIMLLAHTLLNRKQFDKYYWPYIEQGLRAFTSKGKTVHIQLQGKGMWFLDYLKDQPQGLLDLQPELDDVFEVRKLLPNMCLSAGVSLNLLGHGTPEECVAQARRICEELGDHGLILTQDKMGAYPKDCRSENMKAVCEFVQNYRT